MLMTRLIQRALLSATLMFGAVAIVPEVKTMPAIATEVAISEAEANVIRQQNEQTLRIYFDLLSQKRMDEWIELWAENGVQEMPYSPEGFPRRIEGREAIAQHYSGLPTSVGRMEFPGLVIYPTIDPNTLFVEFRGEIEVLATGRPYNNTYAGLFRFEDGKIVLFREYYDPLVFIEAWGDPSGFTQQ